MEIREERAGDVLVLLPDGDLSTGEDCRALEQNLARVLSGGTLLVVLDFSRVGHLTSPALRALLLASRKLARAKGRLVLCGMTAKVQKAFSLSGFDRDFSVVAEREAAVLRALEPVAAVEDRGSARPVAAPPPNEASSAPPQPSPSVPAEPILPAEGAAALVSAVPAAGSEPPVPDAAVGVALRLLAALGAGAVDRLPPVAEPDAAVDRAATALLRALDARPA